MTTAANRQDSRQNPVRGSAIATLALLLAACGPPEPAGSDAGVASEAASSADPGVVTPIVACADLQRQDLEAIGGAGSRVTSAAETEQDGRRVCDVEGVLAPEIGFRIQMPLENWQQRYLQSGCGGLCGQISLRVPAASGCPAMADGSFVVASTDMGHSGRGGDFGLDPQKRIDFAYRGVHLTAVAAKALINAYYGQPPRYAYFSGCSDGGREALIEALRFPEDFDGIVAGAPALNWSVQNSYYHAWQAVSNTGADGMPVITADRLPILHAAVMHQCDGLDGLEDGIITDPRECHVDLEPLRCAVDAAVTDCLTDAETDAVRKLYDGPRDPSTGMALTLGGPQPGSELSWEGVFVPRAGSMDIFSRTIAEGSLNYLVFEADAGNTTGVEDLEFNLESFAAIRALNGLYGATDVDVSAFAAAGGKLILWHGWSDQHISPINTIAWYQGATALLGEDKAADTLQLYLMPGMYHCGGGTGPDRFDLLSAAMQWVEDGRAPAAIETTQYAGDSATDVVRQRPVYPYPAVAAYDGNGSPDDPASFAAAPGRPGPDRYPWAGEDFFRAGGLLDCTAGDGALHCAARTDGSP